VAATTHPAFDTTSSWFAIYSFTPLHSIWFGFALLCFGLLFHLCHLPSYFRPFSSSFYITPPEKKKSLFLWGRFLQRASSQGRPGPFPQPFQKKTSIVPALSSTRNWGFFCCLGHRLFPTFVSFSLGCLSLFSSLSYLLRLNAI
jgi:hypothetical protein